MDLRELKLQRKLETIIPTKNLEKCYWALSEVLSRDYNQERVVTRAEDKVNKLLSDASGLKFYRSLWVGKRNIDFFYPSLTGPDKRLTGRTFSGIALEVDGDVHNEQFKMNKDNSKYELLHRLNILLYTLENQDFNEHSFKSFLYFINKLKRLDSRGRRRVWVKVYLFTITSHLDHFVVKNHFNEGQLELLKQVRGLL